MATLKFPSSLAALNSRLTQCIASKDLQALELGEISFETFFKSLYPFLMRYGDHHNVDQLQLLKRQVVQVFPLPGAGIRWYRVFNSVIGHLLGQNQPIPFETTAELSSLILQLPPRHRMEDLLEVQFQTKNPKQKAEKLQCALCCLLAEEQMMQMSQEQVQLLRPLFGESAKILSDLSDPMIFGALLKYTVNATVLRQSLALLSQGMTRSYHQYLRAKDLLDNAIQNLPPGKMPFDSSEAFIQHEWKKHYIQQRNEPLCAFIVLNSAIFSLTCPIGAWMHDASFNLMEQTLHDQYWAERELMNQRYLEGRSHQAALYDLLYSELRTLYEKQQNKREFVGYLQDLTSASSSLPKSFPLSQPLQIPDLHKFLQPIAAIEKSAPLKSVQQNIQTYSEAVAKSLTLPQVIPEESEAFWKLASRAFTLAADLALASGRKAHFVHPQNNRLETMYLLGAEMRRDNGEMKRGIIYYSIDKEKKCFYRLFVPMGDLEIVTIMGSRNLLSNAFPGLDEATRQRDGSVDLFIPDSLPWQFDSSGMTLQDSRLHMSIQLFSLS